jgi:hypothetical protein
MESNTINRVTDALKAIVRSALCQGFSKSSYLVTNHIKYIKNIRSADNPERYLSFIAKKLFPDEVTILRKFEQIELKYKDDLLFRFKELYAIYLEIARAEIPQRKNISETDADDILAELLF